MTPYTHPPKVNLQNIKKVQPPHNHIKYTFTHPHTPPPTHEKCPPTPTHPKYTSTQLHPLSPTYENVLTLPPTQNVPPPTSTQVIPMIEEFDYDCAIIHVGINDTLRSKDMSELKDLPKKNNANNCKNI